MFRTKAAWIALFLTLSMLVTACGGSSSSAPKEEPKKDEKPAATTPAPKPAEPAKPKVVTIGMWSAPDSFFPPTNKTTYGTNVGSLIYTPLVVLNNEMKWQPSLAEKYEISPDQTKFTFTIRKNAKWSDGKPITAHDVAFTYGLNAHPDVPSSRKGLITTIKGLDNKGNNEKGATFEVEGIKVLADDKIEFTAKASMDVDAFMEKAVSTIFIVPKHVVETYKDLKTIDKAPFVMKPEVTGGAFKFVEYKTDSHVELVRNPDYFLGAPKVEKVFLKIVGATTFAAAIEKQEIDFSTGAGTGEVPITDWDKVTALSHVTPIPYAAPSYQYLDVNTNKPYLANPKVRQGLAQAINRDLIVQRLLKGQGETLGTPINSTSKYYRKDLVNANAFNIEAAKKLLTEGGWDFNREIVLLTPTGNVVREQSADIIQANLQAAGVKVKIEKVDFPTRQAKSKEGNFDISLVGFGAPFDPDFSPQVATGAPFNDRKYSNKQLDDLLTKGQLTAKFEDRKKIYDEIQELFVKELPLIPLYSPKVLVVVNKRVSGLKMGPWGWAWNAHEWDVK